MLGRPETQCYFSRELIVQSARPLGIEAMVDSIDCAALPFGQRLVRSAVVFGGAVYHGKDAYFHRIFDKLTKLGREST
jgi:hypothetical protein